MYPIVDVPSDAANLPEQLGTKEKFWFQKDSENYLFKVTRPGTGEDWSEKVAYELALMLELPCATYDLATWRGHRGVVSKSFVPNGGRLILGNELLVAFDPGYKDTKFYKQRRHTLRGVLAILRTPIIAAPIMFQSLWNVHTAFDVFVGYLMLDAWIANTDHHHQNWGLVLTTDKILHLAPSYDNASSLGRIERDEEKVERLQTKDKNRTIDRYLEKGQSAFYAHPSSEKSLSMLEAFQSAAKIRPIAALTWLKQLEKVSFDRVEQVLHDIPSDRISNVSIDFALKILTLNRERLLKCIPPLLGSN